MGLSLRNIYSLDTLDTRFTSSSQVPYQTVIDARSDPVTSREAPSKTSSPKWRTPEFYLYYVVFALAVPLIFWIPYQVSRPEDPRYHKYEHFLSEGWVPGRKVDITDAQYHTFRSNLPYMSSLLLFHPLLRKVWNAVFPTTDKKSQGAERFEQRVSFDYAFAILFLFILHGFSALKVLLILNVNYRLATKLPREYVPVATWAFNVPVLFANELCQGYHYKDVFGLVVPPLVEWGAWMDSYGGLVSRWEVLFNITILRLISFNLDYYWSIDKRGANGLEVCELLPFRKQV